MGKSKKKEGKARGKQASLAMLRFTDTGTSEFPMISTKHSKSKKIFQGRSDHFHAYRASSRSGRQYCYDAVIHHSEKDGNTALSIKTWLENNISLQSKHAPKIELIGNVDSSYVKSLETAPKQTKTIIILVTKDSNSDDKFKESVGAVWAWKSVEQFQMVPLLFGFGKNESPPESLPVTDAHVVRFDTECQFFRCTMSSRLSVTMAQRDMQHQQCVERTQSGDNLQQPTDLSMQVDDDHPRHEETGTPVTPYPSACDSGMGSDVTTSSDFSCRPATVTSTIQLPLLPSAGPPFQDNSSLSGPMGLQGDSQYESLSSEVHLLESNVPMAPMSKMCRIPGHPPGSLCLPSEVNTAHSMPMDTLEKLGMTASSLPPSRNSEEEDVSDDQRHTLCQSDSALPASMTDEPESSLQSEVKQGQGSTVQNKCSTSLNLMSDQRHNAASNSLGCAATSSTGGISSEDYQPTCTVERGASDDNGIQESRSPANTVCLLSSRASQRNDNLHQLAPEEHNLTGYSSLDEDGEQPCDSFEVLAAAVTQGFKSASTEERVEDKSVYLTPCSCSSKGKPCVYCNVDHGNETLFNIETVRCIKSMPAILDTTGACLQTDHTQADKMLTRDEKMTDKLEKLKLQKKREQTRPGAIAAPPNHCYQNSVLEDCPADDSVTRIKSVVQPHTVQLPVRNPSPTPCPGKAVRTTPQPETTAQSGISSLPHQQLSVHFHKAHTVIISGTSCRMHGARAESASLTNDEAAVDSDQASGCKMYPAQRPQPYHVGLSPASNLDRRSRGTDSAEKKRFGGITKRPFWRALNCFANRRKPHETEDVQWETTSIEENPYASVEELITPNSYILSPRRSNP